MRAVSGRYVDIVIFDEEAILNQGVKVSYLTSVSYAYISGVMK